MAHGVFTPYSTVSPLIRGMPKWVPEDDQERIASYQTYEELYWNVPQTLELIRRGGDDKPIYVPNPRTVVDTTAHYMLKGLVVGYTDAAAVPPEARAALVNFLRRERFYSKLHTAKYSGVVRGDYILHLTADPDKPAGSRLSLNSVDPAAFFPVTDDDDLDRVTKVHLAEQFIGEDDKPKVKRLTYWYETVGGQRRVARDEAIYELDEWAEPEPTPVEVLAEAEYLPAAITAIPVYHLKNQDWQGQPFGSSELRGFERLFAAVNQSISDEEMALALEGLGVYATDAEAPTDDTGQEIPWEIAPARVIEHGTDKRFYRVQGVGSVAPMLDHVRYLEEKLFEASGTTDVARGSVDVGTAESGIALAIKFMPTLAKIELRDLTGSDVLTNFFYDWKAWHSAYEQGDFREHEITPVLGEKLPANREAIRNELNDMLDRQVISRAYYRQRMEELLKYNFPESMEDDVVNETSRISEAMDMMGGRINQELGDADA